MSDIKVGTGQLSMLVTPVDNTGAVICRGVDALISEDSPVVGQDGDFHVTQPQEIVSFSGFYFDAAPNLWLERNVTNGTVTHYPNARSFRMSIGTGATDAITRQTNRVFPYFAGNEQSLHYGVSWDLQDGAKLEIGYGDDANGFFFVVEKVSGQYHISTLLRSSASGSLVETITPQNQWNIDKLNGSGASGLTLDPSKGQMLAMSWTWYGYGSVVWMLKLNGLLRPVHKITAANNQSLPIIGEPNQAIRYKLWNTGVTDGSSYIQVSGISLRDNGGAPDQRRGFARSTPLPVTKNVVANNTYVLVSIRPKVTYKGRNNRGVLGIRNYWLSGTANGTFGVYYNPVLTGAAWTDVDTNNSFVEYDVTANAATGGLLLDSGGLSSNRGSDKVQVPESKDPLAPLSDFTNTNHISLVFKCTANGALDFGFNWNEFI